MKPVKLHQEPVLTPKLEQELQTVMKAILTLLVNDVESRKNPAEKAAA